MAFGAILGGLGSLVGGLASGGLFGGGDSGPGYVYTDPSRDPMAAANYINSLFLQGQTGLFGRDVLQRASPINQILERIQRHPGLSEADKNRASTFAASLIGNVYTPTVDSKERRAWDRAVNTLGISTGDLMGRQRKFQNDMQNQLNRYGESDIMGARIGALDRLAEMSSGFADQYLPQVRQGMQSRLDDQSERMRLEALAGANAGGYNPAGVLGQLGQERLVQQRGMGFDALQQALGLAGGESELLSNFLNLGTSAGQQSATLSTQSDLSAAQIAAQQVVAAQQARQGGESVMGGIGSGLMGAGLFSMLGGGGQDGGGGGGGAVGWGVGKPGTG